MKNFKTLVWIGYILAILSVVIGIIDKIAGFVIFNLTPPSYLIFSGYCLLFIISLSLVQLALGKKE
ncbi:hypothetical protein ACFL4Z_01305 [candidate division KSB1 bacterium]